MSLYLLLAANLGDYREPLEEKAKQKKIRHRRKKKERDTLWSISNCWDFIFRNRKTEWNLPICDTEPHPSLSSVF